MPYAPFLKVASSFVASAALLRPSGKNCVSSAQIRSLATKTVIGRQGKENFHLELRRLIFLYALKNV